ncbi:MAG: protein-disulfide reductase DsbD [Gammaproteobacteria bacterium]
MLKGICAVLALCFWMLVASGSPSQQPVSVDKAFSVSASLFGNDTILVHWDLLPKHHLYRNRFSFKVLQPPNASIGQIIYPTAQPRDDAIFGHYFVYTQPVTLPIPIIKPDLNQTVLQVTYQGCADDGYCYPPTTHTITADFTSRTTTIDTPATAPATPANTDNAQTQTFVRTLAGNDIAIIVLTFLGFGVLLSFTPCVLPMLPILSGIIVGQQKTMNARRGFLLSLTYVLSMSVTYAVAGMLVGLAGSSIQAIFQKPWVIILFSLLFVLLAFSFFGFYKLRLPGGFEEKVGALSLHFQKKGHYLSVAVMGCLATLIVSPCVTPALVGVLGYIGKTGNAAIGAIALFALGFGMGLPLLIVGSLGGKLLPKAGMWMKTLENVFGVFFLAIALWMLNRLLPPPVTLALWSAFFISCAIFMGAFSTHVEKGWHKLWKGMGILFLVYGILLLVGAAQGNGNVFQPLALPPQTTTHSTEENFISVKNLTELKTQLRQAIAQNQPVLLDFYADWCISCQEMKYATLQNPSVLNQLKSFKVIRADVTANNAEEKALMAYFQVVAPPSFLFFNAQGNLMNNLTLVGKVDAPAFLQQLALARNH